MKFENPRALPSSALRRALLLAGSTALIASACTSRPAYGPESNVFAPRYGYGSAAASLAERPAAPSAPSAAASTSAASAGRSNPGETRKIPEIKRDPSNTTVDLSPPVSRATPGPTVERSDAPVEASSAPTPSDALATAPEAAAAAPVSAPVPVKPAVKREDLPFGQPVVGKKGFVYSPYAPDKGQVDVQDIPSGTKVKCPYTNKVFRVP